MFAPPTPVARRPVGLTRDDLWLDVWALDDGSLPGPELGGVLLDGVDLRDSPGFGNWLLVARSRYEMRAREELHEQALRLLATGETALAATTSQMAAAETVSRAEDPPLHAEALRALGSALVHAVSGFDGEGAVVLHQAARRDGPGPARRRSQPGRRPAAAVERLPALAAGDPRRVPGPDRPLGRGSHRGRAGLRAGLRTGRPLVGGNGRTHAQPAGRAPG